MGVASFFSDNRPAQATLQDIITGDSTDGISPARNRKTTRTCGMNAVVAVHISPLHPCSRPSTQWMISGLEPKLHGSIHCWVALSILNSSYLTPVTWFYPVLASSIHFELKLPNPSYMVLSSVG